MKIAFATALAVAFLAACAPKPEKAEAPKAVSAAPAITNTAAAGVYTMDLAHSSLNFRVNHMGLSHYTARFTRLDGKLNFDPAKPGAMSVEATIDPASLQTNYPHKDLDFDAQISGKEFLDAGQFPQITFKSTKVEPTGPNTAKVTGDLSFHGVTRSVELEATFNGGYAPTSFDPMGARIGFSAKGALKRSDFGVAYGIPAPGTTMGVSDLVEFAIESEFTKK